MQALGRETLTSLGNLRRVLRIVAKKKMIGEKATVIHTEVIDVLIVRLHPDGAPGAWLTLETGSVQLPNSADMKEALTGAGNFVDVEVLP